MDRKPGGARRLHVARALSRREVLKLGGAVLAGAALLGTAGCDEEGAEDRQSGGATRLVFSFGPDPSGNLQEVISRFNEEHRGEIQVEYREMPSDTGQYFNQLRTEFQAGASPIDVIGGDLTWTAQLAANGWILNLSDRFTQQMRERFVEAAVNSCTYRGDVWGVPFFTDAGLMYYRKDLLQESGISQPLETWDEFKEVARQVRDESGVPYGFVFQGAEYEGGVVDGLEYVWTHGGDVLNEKLDEFFAPGVLCEQALSITTIRAPALLGTPGSPTHRAPVQRSYEGCRHPSSYAQCREMCSGTP
jgi:multiple sugar transport system substrate-binding protein